eukprot:TRINITY_DN19276_c0_g2_i1.p1 TRINITY_DN19276_c0_g2~~TRINITY_DN19276_c0_g2_i1.p1  ORF type:complete len:468 (-),score=45.90 TRINITY_DN19276_c0_g2_i1:216-1619(-)
MGKKSKTKRSKPGAAARAELSLSHHLPEAEAAVPTSETEGSEASGATSLASSSLGEYLYRRATSHDGLLDDVSSEAESSQGAVTSAMVLARPHRGISIPIAPRGMELGCQHAEPWCGMESWFVESYTRTLVQVTETPFVRHSCLKVEELTLAGRVPVLLVAVAMGEMITCWTLGSIGAPHLSLLRGSSLAFYSCFALSVESYRRAICTEPGVVPDDWKGPQDGTPECYIRDPSIIHRIAQRKKSTQALRYCQQLQKFKPDRAHFCRISRRLVLRMDHYCPWLLGTVGYRNHKYFILFLVHSTVCSGLTGSLCFWSCTHAASLSSGLFTLLFQGMFMSGFIFFPLAPYTIFHLYLLSRNMTTIEFYEYYKPGDPNPFDVGLVKNIKTVMGDAWPLWLLPVGGLSGDGLFFEFRDVEAEIDMLDTSLLSSAFGFVSACREIAENMVGGVQSVATWVGRAAQARATAATM